MKSPEELTKEYKKLSSDLNSPDARKVANTKKRQNDIFDELLKHQEEMDDKKKKVKTESLLTRLKYILHERNSSK